MMQAFEIKVNQETKVMGHDDASVFINMIASNQEGNEDLHFSAMGSDFKASIRHQWFYQALAVGDKISIKLVEVAQADTPISTPIEDYREALKQSNLRAYHQLKKELEEKGLISKG